MTLLNPKIPCIAGRGHRLQALILDWAGTTVDFGSLAPVRTLQRVFETSGVPITEEEARQDMGLPKRDHIASVLRMPRIAAAWHIQHHAQPGQTELDDLYARFVPLQFACLVEYSRVIPGVPEAVTRARGRGLKIGSNTGYTRAMLDVLVENSAREGYCPDCNLSPEDVGSGRPAPFMIFEILRRFHVYPPCAVAKAGDTPADIEEGLNAGVWTIGIAATGNAIGLALAEFENLPALEREQRLTRARE